MPRSTVHPRRLSSWSAVPLAVALGLLSACSGGEESAAPATTSAAAPTSSAGESTTGSAAPDSADPTESRTIIATAEDFSFSLDRDDLTAGSYEIELVNDGAASHDLKVEQDGNDIGGSQVIPPGESTTFTVDLEPGEYVFYCSVGNHRAMGMEVTVTVT